MNEHLHRGPLPSNMSHVMHFEGSRPPPTPREMYAEGMYASIEEQGHYDHKKQAPAPPKRDPNTRLSSTSQTLGQSNYQEIQVQEPSHRQYQDSHHQSHQHHQHHQQSHHQQHHHHQQQMYSDYHNQQQQQQQRYDVQQHHHQQQQQQQYSGHKQQQHHHHQQYTYDQQSPRHSGHSSPMSRSKFSHEPQSPSHNGDKPFSYGQLMSPKLNRVQNGNGHTQAAPSSPTRHEYQREDSPVMAYGKHESTFPSQAHRPPPHGPPPPVPQGQGSSSPRYPSSPVLPRHSVTSLQGNTRQQEPQRSPTPKLSQRSMSVPCNGINKPQPVMSGYGYNGMGHPVQRTPSPPLPPPPPELLELSYTNSPHPQQQYHQNQPQQPTHMLSQMSPASVNQSLPTAHAQSSPRHAPSSNGRTSQAPPPPPLSSIPRKKAEPITQPTDHNRPRKGSYPVDVNGNTQVEQPPRTKSHSPSVSPMRGSFDSAGDQTGLLSQLSKVQLKKTGGRQSFDESPQVEEVQNTPPSPQPVALTPVSKETSPAKEECDVIPVNSAVNMFEQKGRGDTSKNSSMDINIDDIDLNDVPGYTPVTKSTPIWKRDMIEKKNQEKIEEYIAKKRKEKEDAEKWKHVPAWKRKIMMEKAKEKDTNSETDIQKMKEEEEMRKARIREQQEMEKKMDEELQDVPAWKREIMMKRGGAIKNWTDEREDINEQELEEQRLAEMPQVANAEPVKKQAPRPSIDESKIEDEWDSLPAWKKEIMMKRGGALTNWGDEREDKNEDGVEQ